MKNIHKNIHIAVNLTAEDWSLYTETPGAGLAASAINGAIEASFNHGGTRREVEKAALAEMQKQDDFGAVDSEPLYVLQDVLDDLFGKA